MPGAWLVLALALAVVGETQSLSEAQRREEALRHYRAGEESMHLEAFERAVREFKTAIGLDPLLVLAHYNLGQSHMALKQYPEAVQAYLGCREAIERLNSLQQGDLAERERAVDDQLHELQDLIRRVQRERTPDTGNRVMMIEARMRVLEGTRAKGRDQQARVPAELHLALGSAYFRQGALDDAEREWKAAVAADKKLGPAQNNLAVLYMLSERFEEAEERMKLAEKAGFPVSSQFKADLKQRKVAPKQAP